MPIPPRRQGRAKRFLSKSLGGTLPVKTGIYEVVSNGILQWQKPSGTPTSNAFNCLNRQAAVRYIRHLCPPLATILINTYRQPSNLFMDGHTLLSQEGTTQGAPLAMPMYAIGIYLSTYSQSVLRCETGMVC